MASLHLWELAAGTRTVGHVRWLSGAELFADAPWPLARQLEAWFGDCVFGLADDEVTLQHVQDYVQRELRLRLGVQATPVSAVALPKRAVWLAALDDDQVPKMGVRDPFGWASNRWAPEFDLDWLVEESIRGVIRWARAEHGGFKAGGRCPDASEMWLSLHASRSVYLLAIRHRRLLRGRPVRQDGAWFFRPALQRLHGVLQGRL